MTGETVLCIGTRVWHSLWRSTQQTMSRIATQNRVIYFEPGRDPDGPYLAGLRANWRHFFRPQARVLHPGLIVVRTPPPLPYARSRLPGMVLRLAVPLVARINALILRRHVRWAMRTFGVADPILWLYEPRHVHLVGQFGEKLVVYHAYDEMHDFPGNERLRDILRAYDEQLLRQTDVAIAPSRMMTERQRRLNEHSYWVANAVDFDLFNRALDPGTPVAASLDSLPRPIVGYAGWMGPQIDAELLVRVAEEFADGSLVLVGPDRLPASAARERLHSLPNVHFLGAQPLEALPTFHKGFDVALIPYRLEGYTVVIYPLKLHEYLAAGRAVVATALPELRRFQDLVRVTESHQQFVHAVRDALPDYAPERVAERVELARQNTWDRRVQDIYAILERRLAEKRGGSREDGDHVRLLDALQPTD